MKITLKNTVLALAATVASVTLSAPAQAFTFGTNGIQFDKDTQVKLTFGTSNGAYKSALGIYKVTNNNSLVTSVANLFWETKQSDNGGTSDWKGTFGNAVASANGLQTITYTFLANTLYTLGLNSGSFNSATGAATKAIASGSNFVFSTSILNTIGASRNNTQQAVFGSSLTINTTSTAPFTLANGTATNYTNADPFKGPVTIGFDDTGNANDKDFNDFTLTAQAEPVPEPMTMTGLALGVGAMVSARRRKAQKA
jgi:hypothetical protein